MWFCGNMKSFRCPEGRMIAMNMNTIGSISGMFTYVYLHFPYINRLNVCKYMDRMANDLT